MLGEKRGRATRRAAVQQHLPAGVREVELLTKSNCKNSDRLNWLLSLETREGEKGVAPAGATPPLVGSDRCLRTREHPRRTTAELGLRTGDTKETPPHHNG